MAILGSKTDNQEPMAKQVSPPASNQLNIVAMGSVFDGSLTTQCDVRVSGKLIGSLNAKGRAVVATEGEVEGEIEAHSASIAGTVTGDLVVSEMLLLAGTARVDGTIRTARLIVEEGATFNGQCQMGQPGQSLIRSVVQSDPSQARRNFLSDAQDEPSKAARSEG